MGILWNWELERRAYGVYVLATQDVEDPGLALEEEGRIECYLEFFGGFFNFGIGGSFIYGHGEKRNNDR